MDPVIASLPGNAGIVAGTVAIGDDIFPDPPFAAWFDLPMMGAVPSAFLAGKTAALVRAGKVFR